MDSITLSVDQIINIMTSTIGMSDSEILEMHDICTKKLNGELPIEEEFSEDFYRFGLLMSQFQILTRKHENLEYFYDQKED